MPLSLFHDLLSAFAQDVTKNVTPISPKCSTTAGARPIRSAACCSCCTARRLRKILRGRITSARALQIINFLQDIAIDYAKGRIYMPQDELARYRRQRSANRRARHRRRMARFHDVSRSSGPARMLWDGAPLGRVLKGRIGLEMRMIIAGGDRILTQDPQRERRRVSPAPRVTLARLDADVRPHVSSDTCQPRIPNRFALRP